MRVYGSSCDPTVSGAVPAKRYAPTTSPPQKPDPEVAMPRRQLTILALAITSFVLAACSSATAPRREDPNDLNCPNGVITMGGSLVCAP